MSNTSDQTTKPSKTTRLIVGEVGVDTKTGIVGKGHSYDNGKTFVVDDTIYGRIYHADDHDKIWKGIQDQVAKVVDPAKSAADSAVNAADAAVASAQVTSAATSAIASAAAEAKAGANEAMSRALSAWDVATGAKEAVTDFDPLLKSAQSDAKQANDTALSAYEQSRSAYNAVQADSSAVVAMQSSVADFKEDVASAQSVADSAKADAGKALTQIVDTNNALSDAKTAFNSGVAEAKGLASTAQRTADSAVESAGENAKALTSQANALNDVKKAMDSGVASAKGLANAAQATADSAIKSAASVASDLTAVASQAKSNASAITKVTSDVGLLQTTVADNSGNISKIQETATKIQQAVSDNSGAIMTATQTADSAATVASDAKSNATVAAQTASGASVTAKNAQSDATTAMVTASGAVTQASDAKSNATIAVQTASEASVTATNAQGDASIAKQTASEASVQIRNAQGDISKLQTQAGKIEASVATNSGAIANIQVTANELKASVSDNSGKITTAKQTADSAVTVASDARSNATVAIQTASQASITASSASGQAASAVLTANGAMTTASNAKSDATVAVQTASGASLTATNAQSDATIAKQTASEATIQASNAESDFSQLSIRANKIEANVATNSGAIASVQQTATGLTTTVADIKSNGGGVNLVQNTSTDIVVDATNSTTNNWAFATIFLDEQPKQGDLITISAEGTLTGTGTLDEYQVILYNSNTTNARSQAKYLKAGQRDSVTLSLDNLDGSGDTVLLIYAGKAGETAGKKNVIHHLMVEEGTVAHTWAPAPSDLQNQFTQIKQSMDGITTTINDPKVGMTATYQTASQASLTAQNASGQAVTAVTTAQGAVTTAKNAQSDAVVAKQTASEASITASNAAGDASVAKQTASQASISIQNAQSDITSLDARADKLEAFQKDASGNINQIVSRADEVDQTLTNQKGDITNLQSRADKLESSMSTANGQISTLQQTATGLTTTVADIKANGGGVNLAIGTDQAYTMGYGIPNTVWQDGYAYLKLPSNVINGEILPQDPHTFSYNLTPGQEYTQTIWFETDATVKDLSAAQITWWTTAGHDGQSATIINLGENKYKLYSTYKWPGKSDNNVRLFDILSLNGVFDLGTGTYLKFGKLKLEKGMVSHDWSPAPDDLQNQFTQVKQSMDGITTTINDPKTGLNATYQTAAGNATTISNVKGDVSQLQTTANGLTSRVGNLESKTDKQQTTIDQNKNAITLKADQTTVNTLKGTVDQNTATLKTQAGQIQSKVSASDVTGMLSGYATQSYAQSLVTQTADKWNLNITELKTDVNAIKTTGGGVNLVQNTSTDIVIDATNSTTNNWAFATIFLDKQPKQGDLITISAEGALTGTGTLDQYQVILYNSNTTNARSQAKYLKAGQRDSVTLSLDNLDGSGDTVLLIYAGNAGETAGKKNVVHHLMVEEGTVAHTWSPAPSDLATVTSVANLSATVDGIQSQVYNSDGSSRITQLSNLIQSKVGTDDFNNLKKAVDLQTLDSADINNMKTNGHYFVHNLANNPIGGWVYVDVTGDGNIRIRQDVYQDIGTQHKYRRWIDNRWTDWEEGATYSEINQLKDAINLRVTKGDLISQINLQAGASLIQSDKLVLDANTTIVTGNAFIPSAAIESLDASKLTFYGANNTYATIGASVAQYDDDQQKSTINLQYNGGIEIHSSNQQGSILTMHDNTIRLASKSWGDNSNPYQYSGFYAAPNYSLMNTYHRDGTTSGVAIDDSRIWIYGNSKDNQLGALQADVGWYSLNGKTGSLAGDQISLKAGNTQAVLTDNNININNASDTNDKNYDVAIHIKGWAEMTGWFTCMGITQTSLLSTKTRIEPLDTKSALDKIVSANVETYQFKSDVANGKTKRHTSVIIDDVHDVAEYYTPEEFISENRMGRDDGDIIGYLMGSVQELKKQLDELKEKI